MRRRVGCLFSPAGSPVVLLKSRRDMGAAVRDALVAHALATRAVDRASRALWRATSQQQPQGRFRVCARNE